MSGGADKDRIAEFTEFRQRMNQRILVTPRSLTQEPHPHVERMRELGFEIVYSTAGAMPSLTVPPAAWPGAASFPPA